MQFEFYNILTKDVSSQLFDVLFLSDSTRDFYFGGLSGIGDNMEQISNFISCLIQTKGYTNIYFIGTCTGGWMSALQILSLKLRAL